MIVRVLEGEAVEGARCKSSIAGILHRVLLAAMTCFFRCFRINEDTSHLVSQPLPPQASEPVVSRKRNDLSSLFLSEEGDSLKIANKELGTPEPCCDMEELKYEAKFLKACGTLPETPLEIRNSVKYHKDLPNGSDKSECTELNSWLPTRSMEMLNIKGEPDQPITPPSVGEDLKTLSSSLRLPISCVVDVLKTEGDFDILSGSSVSNDTACFDNDQSCSSHVTASSVAPKVLSSIAQYQNKSVQFEGHSDRSSNSSKGYFSEVFIQHMEQSGSADKYSESKPSPYPTPLKLTGEMQTPGTVFPGYLDSEADGKSSRIKSQFAYSVLNSEENFSQWRVLKDGDSESNAQSGCTEVSVEQEDEDSTPSIAGMGKNSDGKQLDMESSLSSWLRPISKNVDKSNNPFGSCSGRNFHAERIPVDRPIIGMVAAHWTEEEHFEKSHKWWDGNGIPNSTNKYKEDQKVSWHATPFEERLEKALSDETNISHRNQISGTPPIAFNESEEADSAISQLRTSTPFKSVASY